MEGTAKLEIQKCSYSKENWRTNRKTKIAAGIMLSEKMECYKRYFYALSGILFPRPETWHTAQESLEIRSI